MFNTKLLQLKRSSSTSITQCVRGTLHTCSFITGIIPKLTWISSGHKFELLRLSITVVFNMRLVYFILDGKSFAYPQSTFTTKINKCSPGVLYPLVIIFAGFCVLWVLMLPYIFPSFELQDVMHDFHLFQFFLHLSF